MWHAGEQSMTTTHDPSNAPINTRKRGGGGILEKMFCHSIFFVNFFFAKGMQQHGAENIFHTLNWELIIEQITNIRTVTTGMTPSPPEHHQFLVRGLLRGPLSWR